MHKKYSIKAELNNRFKEATDWKKSDRIGFPVTEPHPVALEAHKLFLYSNQNHTGTHTRQQRKHNSSHALELEFIKEMGQLFGDKNIDGYVNSGCTEGNLLALWIARNKFKNNYCVIKTNLTHHSIDKAINILNIQNVVTIPVTNKYQMDIKELKKAMNMNLSKKINKFIVCLTVGYTITGTMDDVEKICELLRECKKKEEIDFFIHIDAAIGALIYKLCSKKIFDFSIPEVQTIVLDFHKMGRVPYSAGVFLCRHGLQNHIDRYVSYIGSHSDDTIIGSRGGAPAAACWAVWKTLGKQGFTQMFNTCLRKKAYFLRALKKKIKNIELLDFSPINMFAINFSSLTNSSLPNNIEHHYRIVSSLLPNIQNNKSLNVYKIYIMPHLRYQTIDKFIKDVSNLIYDKNSR